VQSPSETTVRKPKHTWQKSLRRLPPERNLFLRALTAPGTQIFGESIQANYLSYFEAASVILPASCQRTTEIVGPASP
jgi:hypothetical protein